MSTGTSVGDPGMSDPAAVRSNVSSLRKAQSLFHQARASCPQPAPQAANAINSQVRKNRSFTTGPRNSQPFIVSFGCDIVWSEPGVDIELQNVIPVARAIDLVAAHVAQSQPRVFRHAECGPEVVALGVGTALVEIGVCPGIQHRVSLDVPIADGDTPGSEAIDDGPAEADFAHIALVLWRGYRLLGQRLDVRLVVTNIADAFAHHSQRIAG